MSLLYVSVGQSLQNKNIVYLSCRLGCWILFRNQTVRISGNTVTSKGGEAPLWWSSSIIWSLDSCLVMIYELKKHTTTQLCKTSPSWKRKEKTEMQNLVDSQTSTEEEGWRTRWWGINLKYKSPMQRFYISMSYFSVSHAQMFREESCYVTVKTICALVCTNTIISSTLCSGCQAHN